MLAEAVYDGYGALWIWRGELSVIEPDVGELRIQVFFCDCEIVFLKLPQKILANHLCVKSFE